MTKHLGVDNPTLHKSTAIVPNPDEQINDPIPTCLAELRPTPILVRVIELKTNQLHKKP